jgi:hypothetical protein
MQLLDFPPTSHDIKVSLSLTGVTILKEGKYKTRHSLPKHITQIPYGGLVLTKSLPRSNPSTKRKLKPCCINKNEPLVVKPAKPPRQYTIDKKEVSHRIKNYCLQQKGEKQLYFWTVTFPINTHDDICFLLLNKWFTRLKKEKMLKSYLWVSERQQNNTLHFHIAIPHRMCVKKANRYMRACIMWCINKNEIDWDRQQAVKYNGVDIAKNRQTKRVTNFAKQSKARTLTHYLTKYVTKNNGQFTHLAWHCSRDFSNLVISVRLTDREWERDISRNFIHDVPIFDGQWALFYKWKDSPPPGFVKYLMLLNQEILSRFN